MKKIGILAGLLLAGAVLWAEPAVCEGEEVRLYTAVELGVNGNWCKIRLRLGLWNEKSDWIPKGTDCWCFIPEDAKIFRK